MGLCLTAGLEKKYEIAGFPIDFILINPDTNYVTDKSKGKNGHLSRERLNIL